MNRLLLLILSMLPNMLIAQENLLLNGSFDEGDHVPRHAPYQWEVCINDAWSTPVHQPGLLDVNLAPYDGDTYVSMLTRGVDTIVPFKSQKNDYLTQKLTTPLQQYKQYIFKGMFAYEEFIDYQNTEELQVKPIKLKIFASNSLCDTLIFLGEIPLITNENWEEQVVCITPRTQGINYLRIQTVCDSNIQYNGIALLDALSLTEVGDDVGYIESKLVLDTMVFQGSSFDLSPTKDMLYQWIPTDGLSCSYCQQPTVIVDESITYLALYEKTDGCRYAESFRLRVPICEDILADRPNRTIPVEVTKGETVTLQANDDPSIIQYAWTPEEAINCTDCPTNTITATENQTYSVTMTTLENCAYTYNFRINLNLNIPNIITPNSDGKNDFFEIYGLTENTTLTILDRNGALIFKSINYDNSWNGKDTDGFSVPSDTYWYILELKNGKQYKGYVFVKRE